MPFWRSPSSRHGAGAAGPAAWQTRREPILSWLQEAIPTRRMLERAPQDPQAPYTGGASTFCRFVAQLRAELGAGAAAPVIRFEDLPGEYVQWHWGEARVRLGRVLVKRLQMHQKTLGSRSRAATDAGTMRLHS